jgi:anti-sigma regulatory factor (Ser/Thr protein kinase)
LVTPASRDAGRLELELPLEMGSIGEARRAARAFAAEHGAESDDVALAVSEAAASIVLHASSEANSGTILIRGECDGGDLVLTVSRSEAGTAANQDASELGLGGSVIGFSIMNLFPESVEIERTARGAPRLVMRFPIRRAD